MPALDLTLRLWITGRAAQVRHVLFLQPFGQFGQDIRGAVVRQQSGTIGDGEIIEPGGFQREVQRFRDIIGLHGRAELRQ